MSRILRNTSGGKAISGGALAPRSRRNNTLQVDSYFRGGAGLPVPTSSDYLVVAGGGGAGLSGTGGSSIGGSGGNNSNGGNGSVNRGGGGGGAGFGGGVYHSGGSGGSGVVVIRYPDSFNAAVATTGSPNITTNGGYRIYQWTSSGSITF